MCLQWCPREAPLRSSSCWWMVGMGIFPPAGGHGNLSSCRWACHGILSSCWWAWDSFLLLVDMPWDSFLPSFLLLTLTHPVHACQAAMTMTWHGGELVSQGSSHTGEAGRFTHSWGCRWTTRFRRTYRSHFHGIPSTRSHFHGIPSTRSHFRGIPRTRSPGKVTVHDA